MHNEVAGRFQLRNLENQRKMSIFGWKLYYTKDEIKIHELNAAENFPMTIN